MQNSKSSLVERLFHLDQNHTTVRTEIAAGVTNFMTMAYIIIVNPSLLSATGMDQTAVMIATCLVACVGTVLMALMANYPFAIAPGMGLNAYFAFTVCLGMGYDWRIALMAVLVEGVIFTILTLTNLREAIFNAFPDSLKKGISVGIGLFIAYLGLQNAGIIVKEDSTLTTLIGFSDQFHTAGICALLALVGVTIIVVLSVVGVKGAILIGIVGTWGLGIICQLTGIYQVDPANGFYSLYPSFGITDFSTFGNTCGQVFRADFSGVHIPDFIVMIFSFFYVDMFDTIGTVMGVATSANILDEEGKLPRAKSVLLVDAIATIIGAIFGTSTATTFVESSAGFSAGARTGLASIATGALFFLAMFFAPVFTAIPSFATAPALIYVGFLMMRPLGDILKIDLIAAVPAYLCLLTMPLSYSISDGIAIGTISYVVIHLLSKLIKKTCRQEDESQPLHVLMYILAILFVPKYIFL